MNNSDTCEGVMQSLEEVVTKTLDVTGLDCWRSNVASTKPPMGKE